MKLAKAKALRVIVRAKEIEGDGENFIRKGGRPLED